MHRKKRNLKEKGDRIEKVKKSQLKERGGAKSSSALYKREPALTLSCRFAWRRLIQAETSRRPTPQLTGQDGPIFCTPTTSGWWDPLFIRDWWGPCIVNPWDGPCISCLPLQGRQVLTLTPNRPVPPRGSDREPCQRPIFWAPGAMTPPTPLFYLS